MFVLSNPVSERAILKKNVDKSSKRPLTDSQLSLYKHLKRHRFKKGMSTKNTNNFVNYPNQSISMPVTDQDTSSKVPPQMQPNPTISLSLNEDHLSPHIIMSGKNAMIQNSASDQKNANPNYTYFHHVVNNPSVSQENHLNVQPPVPNFQPSIPDLTQSIPTLQAPNANLTQPMILNYSLDANSSPVFSLVPVNPNSMQTLNHSSNNIYQGQQYIQLQKIPQIAPKPPPVIPSLGSPVPYTQSRSSGKVRIDIESFKTGGYFSKKYSAVRCKRCNFRSDYLSDFLLHYQKHIDRSAAISMELMTEMKQIIDDAVQKDRQMALMPVIQDVRSMRPVEPQIQDVRSFHPSHFTIENVRSVSQEAAPQMMIENVQSLNPYSMSVSPGVSTSSVTSSPSTSEKSSKKSSKKRMFPINSAESTGKNDRMEYQCKRCGKSFERRDRFFAHYEKHMGSDPVDRQAVKDEMISIVKQAKKTRSNFRMGQLFYDNLRFEAADPKRQSFVKLEKLDAAVKCRFCSVVTHSIQGWYEHYLSHQKPQNSQNVLMKCDECDFTYTSVGAFAVHKISHLESNKKQKNTTRPAMPASKKSLLLPNGNMLVEAKIKCNVCLQGEFSNIHTLNQHMQREHAANMSSMYTCAKCTKAFADFNALSNHLKAYHGYNTNLFFFNQQNPPPQPNLMSTPISSSVVIDLSDDDSSGPPSTKPAEVAVETPMEIVSDKPAEVAVEMPTELMEIDSDKPPEVNVDKASAVPEKPAEVEANTTSAVSDEPSEVAVDTSSAVTDKPTEEEKTAEVNAAAATVSTPEVVPQALTNDSDEDDVPLAQSTKFRNLPKDAKKSSEEVKKYEPNHEFRSLEEQLEYYKRLEIFPKYSCKYCDKTDIEHEDLAAHLKTHSINKRILVCDMCDFFTLLANKFAEHQLVTHKDVMLEPRTRYPQCMVCSDVLKMRIKEFETHMALHNTYMRFGCTMCSYRFHDFDRLKDHCRIAHYASEPRRAEQKIDQMKALYGEEIRQARSTPNLHKSVAEYRACDPKLSKVVKVQVKNISYGKVMVRPLKNMMQGSSVKAYCGPISSVKTAKARKSWCILPTESPPEIPVTPAAETITLD